MHKMEDGIAKNASGNSFLNNYLPVTLSIALHTQRYPAYFKAHIFTNSVKQVYFENLTLAYQPSVF